MKTSENMYSHVSKISGVDHLCFLQLVLEILAFRANLGETLNLFNNIINLPRLWKNTT
jgi:hypothetical protein